VADWLDGLADALGVNRLSPAEIDQLLDLARDVAHGTERKNAPLATFLAGRAVASGQPLDDVQRITAAVLSPRES